MTQKAIVYVDISTLRPDQHTKEMNKVRRRVMKQLGLTQVTVVKANDRVDIIESTESFVNSFKGSGCGCK